MGSAHAAAIAFASPLLKASMYWSTAPIGSFELDMTSTPLPARQTIAAHDEGRWAFVYNHLHTVHAIASCNAAEIAMGMLMEATVPTSHRWIPKSMNVQYLEKATTSLRAQARLDPPDFTSISEGAEIVVPVSVVDKAGTEVVHADITCWVTAAR